MATFAELAASMISLVSLRLRPMGLSTTNAMPASIAAKDWDACTWVPDAMTIKSMP